MPGTAFVNESFDNDHIQYLSLADLRDVLPASDYQENWSDYYHIQPVIWQEENTYPYGSHRDFNALDIKYIEHAITRLRALGLQTDLSSRDLRKIALDGKLYTSNNTYKDLPLSELKRYNPYLRDTVECVFWALGAQYGNTLRQSPYNDAIVYSLLSFGRHEPRPNPYVATHPQERESPTEGEDRLDMKFRAMIYRNW